MKKIINKNINIILLIFLYIQPLLDVITAISINYLKINFTISSIIRLIFLMFLMFYSIFISKNKNKKQNILFILLIILYIFSFSIITIIYKDANALKYELKNTLNTFYFPITLITLLDIYNQNEIKLKIKYIVYLFSIYVIFIIIPNLTNTSFLSYSHSKEGNIGWFLSANAVGNILSILTPFIIIYLIKIKDFIIIKSLLILSTIYVFLSMGTKVPILSLIICILGTIIFYIKKYIKEKNYKKIKIIATISSIIIIISCLIIPKTSFYKNLEIHKNYLGLNNYFEVFTKYELIDHFIFSQRLTFLENTNNNFKKANIIEKTFGIGYIENYNTEYESNKTIEIDYFEIFYRHGIIGFSLYISIIILIIKREKINTKENSIINTEYRISILLILLLALFSGHIIITPAVSIFVSLIILIIIKGGLNEKIN